MSRKPLFIEHGEADLSRAESTEEPELAEDEKAEYALTLHVLTGRRLRRYCLCCCGCGCVLLGVLVATYFVVVHNLFEMAKDQMTATGPQLFENCYGPLHLTPQNLTANIWWPGCGYANIPQVVRQVVVTRTSPDFSACGPPCFSGELIAAMRDFNGKHGFRRVHYPSRQGPDGQKSVQLGGWWLPPDPARVPAGKRAPRIVVQHGAKDNGNHFRAQLFAYLLRSMGFGVLLNNFRGTCYSSDAVPHRLTWGFAYPYDLLGAWDFAVGDPAGMIGGALPPGQVGILGFSMGGFVAATAFGLEGRVPAAWLDAAPAGPRSALDAGARALFPAWVVGAFEDATWSWLQEDATVDLEENTPAKTLPLGPSTSRPVAIAASAGDSTVRLSSVKELQDTLLRLPAKYDLREFFETDAVNCHGTDHVVMHLHYPVQYRDRLCRFWTRVFRTNESDCGLATLPTFGMVDAAAP